MRAIVFSIAILLATVAVARAQRLTYGPILGRGATPDRVVIKWGTDSASDPTTVQYRLPGGAFQTVTGAPGRDHEVLLSGLSLASAYEYFVASGPARSPTHRFATCPQPGAPMELVFYGDSRSNPAAHARVVAQVVARAPDTVFDSGDITRRGTYGSYLSEFFPVAAPLVASTPFMAAPGNHDADSSLGDNFARVFPFARSDISEPWRSHYSFQCGNARFIALDTNHPADTIQRLFLDNALAAARADSTTDHVFVWFHESPYSTGEHGDSQKIQREWVPFFRDPANKVRAVFSGHDHVYNRLSDGSRVTYVVSGGAGAGLYAQQSKSRAKSLAFRSAYNFVSVRVVGPQVTATAYDDNGTRIDTWSVTAPPPPRVVVNTASSARP